MQRHLEEILVYEISQRRLRLIPTESATPAMKARTLKMLGTPTCDAQELAAEALFSIDEVKLAAIAESARLEEAGFTDRVQATQPQVTPLLNDALVGTRLEICYRYYSPENSEKLLMWCPAEVLQVADGLSDKASARCTKMLPAGAVLIKWPADADRGEKETVQWKVLIPNKFNSQAQNAWRIDPRDLATARPPVQPEGGRTR